MGLGGIRGVRVVMGKGWMRRWRETVRKAPVMALLIDLPYGSRWIE